MLLSIIIPTKNRQYTCVYAVESALKIENDNFEVIVQDCSDDDSLKQMLANKFNDDKRLKYFYTDEKPSMNENWSMAISKTKGEFIYGIGDDDAVLPSIIEVAQWMSANKIEAVIPLRVTYTWPDALIGSFSNSRLSLPSNFKGKIRRVDLENEFNRKVKNCGFGYNFNLPNIYHGFASRRILELNKLADGSYFAGTSLDVYSAFTLPLHIKEFYYIEYPISIWGASGRSNSNRNASKKIEEHYKEFQIYNRLNNLPKAFNAEVSVAETTIQALKDINRDDLISTMNLSLVYAKSAIQEPNKFFHFYEDYKANKNPDNKNKDFFIAFSKFKKAQIKSGLINFFTKLLFPIIPNAQLHVERITGNKKPICNNISECLKYIEDYEKENNIKIQFDGEISILQTTKEIWE